MPVALRRWFLGVCLKLALAGGLLGLSGEVVLGQGQYNESLESAEALLKRCQGSWNAQPTTCIQEMYSVAQIYETMGHYADAETIRLKVIDIKKKWLQDVLAVMAAKKAPAWQTSFECYFAKDYTALARFYTRLGRYAEAEPLYQQAQVWEKKGWGEKHPTYATTLSGLAVLYMRLGRYVEAEQLLKQVVATRLATKDKWSSDEYPSYEDALSTLAAFYTARGRYTEAESLYQQVVRLSGNYSTTGQADALLSLADLYYRTGRYADAEPLCKKAIEIFKYNYADVNFQQDPKGLKDRYWKAEQHPDHIRAVLVLTRLYEAMKRYAEAEALYQKSLAAQQQEGGNYPSYSNTLHNLAGLYQATGRYVQADSLYQKVLALRKEQLGEQHIDYLASLNKLADLYERQEQFSAAEELSARAIDILITHLRRTFPAMSEREKQQFTTTMTANFEARHSLLVKQRLTKEPPNTGRTYNHLLFTKGLLLAATANTQQQIMASGDTALRRRFGQWQALRRQVVLARNLPPAQQQQRGLNPARLDQQANELEKELAARSSAFAQGAALPTVTWQQVQHALRPGEVAIELVRYRWRRQTWTDTIYYSAYLLTPSRAAPQLVVLPNGNALETQYLPAYRHLTHTPGTARGAQDANAHMNTALADAKVLYRAFWQPIAQALPPGTTTVYLSADGVYPQLNLTTLQNPATGRYLLDELDLRLVGSTRELVTAAAAKSGAVVPGPSVLVGAPAYRLQAGAVVAGAAALASRSAYSRSEGLLPAGEVPPLPGTARELDALQAQLTAAQWPHRAFVGEQATEEAVRDVRHPRVLHIATHGFFVPAAARPAATHSADRELSPAELAAATDPMLRSGLLLAGVSNFREAQPKPATEDGILTAYEASLLDLQGTELVVLSACETGLGQAQAGEGVYGLQRGLRVAGARAVLMSLWKVDDAATQELMGAFYQSWLAGKSKRAALLAAQQQIRQRHPEPYYWGAFVLVGE